RGDGAPAEDPGGVQSEARHRPPYDSEVGRGDRADDAGGGREGAADGEGRRDEGGLQLPGGQESGGSGGRARARDARSRRATGLRARRDAPRSAPRGEGGGGGRQKEGE